MICVKYSVMEGKKTIHAHVVTMGYDTLQCRALSGIVFTGNSFLLKLLRGRTWQRRVMVLRIIRFQDVGFGKLDTVWLNATSSGHKLFCLCEMTLVLYK